MPVLTPPVLPSLLARLKVPTTDSHKGQNGKLLIIGGSELFHAASKWSLDVASRLVDMVFYSSVPSNNELIKQAKGQFWNGLVIARTDLDSYIDESDVILIGPGMQRSASDAVSPALSPRSWAELALTSDDWDHDTAKCTNSLLARYPAKRWVIDAGALQMVDPQLLTPTCVITPHAGEATRLFDQSNQATILKQGVTVLQKGPTDQVWSGDQEFRILGGHPGMTKGGTGDVLAGLVAGLYATCHDPVVAAVVGSYVNKAAGESLATEVGPYFNASDLADAVPRTLFSLLQSE